MQQSKQSLINAIDQALERDQEERALGLAVSLVKGYPDQADAQLLFSRIMLEAGRNKLALDSARKAIALDTSDSRAMMHLSSVYYKCGFLEQAIQAAIRAAELVGDDGDELSTLGGIFYKLGEYERSIAMHESAVKQDESNHLYWYNLGISVQASGDLDRGEQIFLRALELQPDFARAYSSLARIRKQTPDKNHIREMERLVVSSEGDVETAMHLSYALAKEYEDIGDHANAFAFLKSGSDIRRQGLQYDVSKDVAFVERLIRCFPPGCFDDYQQGYRSAEPIFIVGMPRSGTTLTEQILASHSDVFAAGELRDFGMNLTLQAGDKLPVEMLDDDRIRRLLGTNAAGLGERYIDKTRPRTGHTAHFIDKLPRNSHYLGFIHWALPEAKIILLDRHPVDVCFSNYKVLFKNGYEYSYQLDELAEYYLSYCRLMDHWQQVIPADRLYRIRYEDLVADQEQQSRALLEFCGLPWQDQCLEFYRNREGVTTASLAQVRQPIYNSAVARWRNYEPFLRPLIQRLENAGLDCS